jgi:hypothetical protein
MHRVVPARRAELFQLQPVLILLLVLRRRVVAILTIAALQCDDFTHGFWSSAISLQQDSYC